MKYKVVKYSRTFKEWRTVFTTNRIDNAVKIRKMLRENNCESKIIKEDGKKEK